MAKLQGTILASKIVPTDSLDTYATHDDKYGRGGHRSVDTIVERDEISTERRKEGMTVYVKENKTKYILENGIENANWKVDSSGGGSVDLSDYYKKTETETLLSNKIDKGVGVVGSTKTKVTYNNDGIITGGADLEEADLPDISQSKITNLETDLSNKQDTLVSGTNIKTINGQSVLGSGSIDLEGLSTLSHPKLNVEVLTERRHPVSGKPIYVKTIDFGYLPNATFKNVPHTVIGYDYIGVNLEYSYIYLPGVSGFSFSGANVIWNNKVEDVGTYIDGSNISMATGKDRTNMKAYITVQYTKTTDTAESPVRLVGGGSGGDVDLTDYYTKSETETLVDTKQNTLVSGTSIKTINGQSLLGNGNIFVTAEVDLTNYYTKPQVDGFINDINAELGSMVILGEYGVRWNQETDVYEALGSVNRRQIQGNMKRCVLKDDGTVNYYLNPENSALKTNGTPAVLTGADGNVMVEVPKFWYKHTLVGDTHEWWVSHIPLDGYSVHPWFLEGGVERPFRYYRAYIPTVVSGKLRSISGATPTRNQTRATFRTQARANGAGWNLCSWNAVNAIQILFLTEYCTFNSQAVLGSGNDSGSDFGITTGQSNSIGNASSGDTNNNMWMSYRGIENWYADCLEFIDGINVQNYKVFLNQNPSTFADDVFTGDYVDSGVTIPANMTASYIKKISGNFLPTAIGGSSSTFVTDGGWSATGNTVAFFGGNASGGLAAGGFCFLSSVSSVFSGANLSAGLSR